MGKISPDCGMIFDSFPETNCCKMANAESTKEIDTSCLSKCNVTIAMMHRGVRESDRCCVIRCNVAEEGIYVDGAFNKTALALKTVGYDASSPNLKLTYASIETCEKIGIAYEFMISN